MKKTLLGAVLLAGLCPLFAQTIQNGVLDLRNKDFTRESRFLISGKMGFYNGQLRIRGMCTRLCGGLSWLAQVKTLKRRKFLFRVLS